MENKKRSPKPIGPYIIPLLALMVVLGVLYLNRDALFKLIRPTDTNKSKPEWEQTLSNLEQEIAEKLRTDDHGEAPTGERGVGMPADTTRKPTDQPSELQQVQDAILAFFHHLDQQKYIIDYQLQDECRIHFSHTLEKVFANPPIVTREADDLFSILKNMSHFYRILGRQEINLIKDVLAHETENMEQTMAVFYRWSEIGPPAAGNGLDLAMPLASLYEYAGFFINTLGGQAYLFRRDPRIRLLVRYYALLIIDRANDQDLNRHGIDIRLSIDSLIDEMEATQVLDGREEYLTRLAALQTKYQSKYQ
jgi:hypothetical protein